MTPAQKALITLVVACDRRAILKRDVLRLGLENEFLRAKRAGLIQSAGHECSPAGDDWLDSAEGRAALALPLEDRK